VRTQHETGALESAGSIIRIVAQTSNHYHGASQSKHEVMMRRKQNFQTIAWFWDLYQRTLLDLDPPYQRRSVWNQSYKDHFIDTILLGYPAPAIFLYEQISPEGTTLYHVVDGKQRMMTIFEFAENRFPVFAQATSVDLRDRYFRDLPDEIKRDFWGYPFSVEYIPTDELTIIDNVFDRLNRNTAKLTAQELRHAKFSGAFISAAEEHSEWMSAELGSDFPYIAPQSRRQMKDVELVAHLLLQLENGPRGYSSADLDNEFNEKDEDWPGRVEVGRRFRRVIGVLSQFLQSARADDIKRSRLRNQADFYSLFGAIDLVQQTGQQIDVAEAGTRLAEFVGAVEDEGTRTASVGLRRYYDAARSASNDTGPRQTRVRLLSRVLNDEDLDEELT